MKTLYLLGACALLSTTLFSCSADDLDTNDNAKTKETIKQEIIPASYATGPDDDPITVPPPKKP